MTMTTETHGGQGMNMEPHEMHPASLDSKFETAFNSEEGRKERLAQHRAAVELLNPVLKKGDRIRATKAECCAVPATYTFDGWDGGWIVSVSGINTIIPCSVTSINGREFSVEKGLSDE